MLQWCGMEESKYFAAGETTYELRMWFERGEGAWYEIYADGNLLGVRNPWPIDAETRAPLTKEELLTAQKALFVEQARRKADAKGSR